MKRKNKKIKKRKPRVKKKLTNAEDIAKMARVMLIEKLEQATAAERNELWNLLLDMAKN